MVYCILFFYCKESFHRMIGKNMISLIGGGGGAGIAFNKIYIRALFTDLNDQCCSWEPKPAFLILTFAVLFQAFEAKTNNFEPKLGAEGISKVRCLLKKDC